MTAQIYGIKNCDTMKKALNWFDENGVDHVFHDYKKEGADSDILRAAMAVHGWENVINRKGMSWRKLPDDVKNSMDEDKAIEQTLANPSLIKRPLLVYKGQYHLGFKAEDYAAIFGV